MVDGTLILQASVTKTGTFNGAGLTVPYGTPRRGLVARVLYSAATNASGSNSVTFTVDYAPDGSTWNTLASAVPVALSTTAQAAELDIPFITPAGGGTSAAIRLTATFGGAGSTPTITYSAAVGNAFP